jgi:large subunit ribosomal protein L18
MNKETFKNLKKTIRHKRVRAKVSGTGLCPRLCVFRSNKGMFIQIIDDQKGITLVSADSHEIKGKTMKKSDASFELGKLIAKKALEKKIDNVIFDRGGNKYHGRVEAAAKGAREGGLLF